MADRCCDYCDDRGDCERCSPFYEPNALHSKCGRPWREHVRHEQPASNQGIYPGWSTCPTDGGDDTVSKDTESCTSYPVHGLPKVTYKPGWTITWEMYETEPHLFIRLHVEGPDSKGTDAYKGDTPREADFLLAVPTDADLGRWLLNRIHGLEYHEVCEWLRFDGVLVDDPHADGGDGRNDDGNG